MILINDEQKKQLLDLGLIEPTSYQFTRGTTYKLSFNFTALLAALTIDTAGTATQETAASQETVSQEINGKRLLRRKHP